MVGRHCGPAAVEAWAVGLGCDNGGRNGGLTGGRRLASIGENLENIFEDSGETFDVPLPSLDKNTE